MKRIKSLPYLRILMVIAGLALAVAVRLSFIDYKSSDFFAYTKDWYNTIRTYGFAAFGQDFSNYNMPYLYMLYVVARLFPDLPPPVAVKLPSLLADFISAWLVYRIVRLRYQAWALPVTAGFAALFAPTVLLNGALWGQADALYTCALLATLYCLIARRPLLALLAFGLAVSFKSQGVFLAPVVIAMFFRKEIPWKYALLVPLVMVLALIPALLAGRPWLDLLMIYPSQADQYSLLSMHAPSLYALMPDNGKTYPLFYPVGLILTAAIAFFLVVLIQQSHAKLTPGLIVELSLASVLLMPFFLPKMHERYFFPADLISIIFAAFFPAYYYVAIGMSVISFLAYQPYLFGQEPVPLPYLALGVLALVCIVTWHAIRDLFACQAAPVEPE